MGTVPENPSASELAAKRALGSIADYMDRYQLSEEEHHQAAQEIRAWDRALEEANRQRAADRERAADYAGELNDIRAFLEKETGVWFQEDSTLTIVKREWAGISEVAEDELKLRLAAEEQANALRAALEQARGMIRWKWDHIFRHIDTFSDSELVLKAIVPAEFVDVLRSAASSPQDAPSGETT